MNESGNAPSKLNRCMLLLLLAAIAFDSNFNIYVVGGIIIGAVIGVSYILYNRYKKRQDTRTL